MKIAHFILFSLAMASRLVLAEAPMPELAKMRSDDVIQFDRMRLHGIVEGDKLSFATGEEMLFRISLIDERAQKIPPGICFVEWTRDGDDGKRMHEKTPLNGDYVEIRTSLDRPGFVRIVANLVGADGKPLSQNKIIFEGGAGVQIEKIGVAADEPPDFDAFWAAQKRRLDAVPIKAKLERVSPDGANVEVFAVSVDCAGSRPVTGFLTIPAAAVDASLPAEALFHGYSTHTQTAPNGGPADRIRFDVNAHGYDLGADKEYYAEFFRSTMSNGKNYALDPLQNADPLNSYFNGMTLRVMRALQYLKTLPQWNGKDLSVRGGSQGGLQTVWAAALDADVTAANADIPWCCDLAGVTRGRIAGWRPEYTPGLLYYDAAIHGKRISTNCQFSINRAGLGDYVCPPSGVAALYNGVKAPKKINWIQGGTHGYVPKDAQVFSFEAQSDAAKKTESR